MKSERTVTMTLKEIRRLKVIESIIEKRMKQIRGAQLLKVTERQVRRMVSRVKHAGAEGIAHRLRGRASNRRYSKDLKEKVMRLCRQKYEGFGPTLAQEKLREIDKQSVSRETLRQWLIEEALWEPSKKGQKHRRWRERKGCAGEMVQFDGSHHDWLEGRGPWLVLDAYIDDATNKMFARFYDYEGTLPAMDSFYRYSQRYGFPHSLYLDRLKAYCGSGKLSVEEELAGKEKRQSQFERALAELEVEVIHAQSPQAKGRVERLFKTLQDRLVKEMRLAGVKTKEEANAFLEVYLVKHNKRFSVKAREEADLHRRGVSHQALKQILSIQEERVVRKDGTIRHEGKLYQLKKSGPLPKTVTVQQRLDGKMYVVHMKKELVYWELNEAARNYQSNVKQRKQIRALTPAMGHPWKRPNFRQEQLRSAQKAAA